jgi:hypothetical protein
MTTFQFEDVTATTDGNGYFTFVFDNNIDAVIAGVNSPQASPNGDNAVVGASAVVTGAKTVKVRVWVSTGIPDEWSVRAANAKQVEVTLLGLSV